MIQTESVELHPVKEDKMPKKKLFKPAHFKGSGCGSHGHIVFSDGTRGEDCGSEADALKQLKVGCQDGKLFDIEVLVVREQITKFFLLSTIRDEVERVIDKVLSEAVIVIAADVVSLFPCGNEEMEDFHLN